MIFALLPKNVTHEQDSLADPQLTTFIQNQGCVIYSYFGKLL